jgi:uncharacterized protein (DUF302 family)
MHAVPVLLLLFLFASGCDDGPVVTDDTLPDRPGLALAESDASVAVSFDRLTAALDAAPPVSVVAEVDHAQNAATAGLVLRPTRVVLFGNPQLGTPIMQANQQAGLDLPQKMLVYEDAEGRTVVGYNTTDYLAQRHGVGGVEALGQIAGALRQFAGVAAGDESVEIEIDGGSVGRDEGVVSVESDNSFGATYDRLVAAIAENPNLTVIAELDHAANAASVGLDLRPTRLVVFGNPALGTQLMQSEQTVGIDLPQKVLVYEEADGTVRLAYNSPGFLADRHDLDDVGDVLDTIETALEALAEAATSADE